MRFVFIAATSSIFMLFHLIKVQHYRRHADRYTDEARYRLARKMMDHLRRRGRVQTIRTGTEYLPEQGGYILCSNHQGRYDTFGIFLSHDKPCSVLVRRDKSHAPSVTQSLSMLGAKRLKLNDPKQQIAVLHELSEEVKQGRRFLIYPEGDFGDNKNTLQPFHYGCFRCAFEAKCPIVPVAIIDSYLAFNGNHFNRVTTQVHFLPPVYYEEYKHMRKPELSEYIKAKIQEKMTEVLTERETAADETPNAL